MMILPNFRVNIDFSWWTSSYFSPPNTSPLQAPDRALAFGWQCTEPCKDSRVHLRVSGLMSSWALMLMMIIMTHNVITMILRQLWKIVKWLWPRAVWHGDKRLIPHMAHIPLWKIPHLVWWFSLPTFASSPGGAMLCSSPFSASSPAIRRATV